MSSLKPTEAFQEWRANHGTLLANVQDYESCFLAGVADGQQREREKIRATTPLFGPPPWKVEDAFEVYFERAKERVMMPVEELFNEKTQAHKTSRDAFLAGAEYGAAAGYVRVSPFVEFTPNIHVIDTAIPRCNSVTSNGPGLFCDRSLGHTGECQSTPVSAGEEGHHANHFVVDEAASLPWATFRMQEFKTSAIPSREEWQLERCRTLVFAILGGIAADKPTATVTDVDHEKASVTFDVSFDPDPVGDYINELRDLWETM